MIRRREFSTREMLRALPKDQHAQFLELDAAERKLLMNGSNEEREQYGWLPAGAAKKFAKLPEAERRQEAVQAARERRRERAPAAAPVKVVAKVAPEVCESSARVAESVRDIFELSVAGLERAQSIAMNCLQQGDDEEQALDRVAAVMMDELPMTAVMASVSRMRLMFARGNFVRG